MIRSNDIIDKVNTYLNLTDKDMESIRAAYVYCAKVHTGQKRVSGEPYLSHPLEVTNILADMKLDVYSIITGLLHDTIEDTLATKEELESIFGEEVAFLVDGVTKISRLNFNTKIEEQAESFRKLILATAKDIRVILIKLADRLHNMRTLQFLPEEKQKRIARETFEIYAPLAHRLGIYWLRTELEDLSFKYLKPEEYKKIYKLTQNKEKESDKYIDQVKTILQGKFEEFGINAEIQGRMKHLYGIYNKMIKQNIEFDKVYDVIAFRIITNSINKCYEALGIVHTLWKPVPGRFKDFIALPKQNGYQSLHTTVIGPVGERIEIQIRTKSMHEVSEYGISAHWKYKEGKLDKGDFDKVYYNLRQLLEWKDIKDPNEFLEAVKGDLIPHMVYVFTPNGDLKELPNGATPVDFAYSIHTEVGHHCSRALVNGKLVSLDYTLRSGEIVEIITRNDKNPNQDWLKFVITSRAKTKIRTWLRAKETDQSKIVGKSICERKFKQSGLDFQKEFKTEKFKDIISQHNIKDLDELYIAVGYGKISASDIVKHFKTKDEVDKSEERKGRINKIIKTITRDSSEGVLVRGYDDILIRIANCCSPLPGEDIIGFITRGRGISIHKANCHQLFEIDPARKIEVDWDKKFQGLRPTRIIVRCKDQPGILSNITKSISSSEINISKAEMYMSEVDTAVGTFDVNIKDIKQLEKLISNLTKIRGVKSVERVGEPDSGLIDHQNVS